MVIWMAPDLEFHSAKAMQLLCTEAETTWSDPTRPICIFTKP